MGRARDPRRNEAMRLYLVSEGREKPKDLAELLHLPSATIRKWKSEDKWDEELKKPLHERNIPKRKSGPPYGSKNAKGNKGGKGGPVGNQYAKGHGSPKGSQNALKTGAYAKLKDDFFTDEELEVKNQASFDVASKLKATYTEMEVRERFMRGIFESLKEDKSLVTEERKTVVSDGKGNAKSKEISQTTKPLVDSYVRVSDALTKVSTGKAKVLDSLIKLGEVSSGNIERPNPYRGLSEEELRNIAKIAGE